MGDNILGVQAEGHDEHHDKQAHPEFMTFWINDVEEERPSIEEKIMERGFDKPVEEDETHTNPDKVIMDALEGLALDFHGSHRTAGSYLFRQWPPARLGKQRRLPPSTPNIPVV